MGHLNIVSGVRTRAAVTELTPAFMMGATAGALAGSSLDAVQFQARLATQPPELLPAELQQLELHRRLQRLELPWLDLPPAARAGRSSRF